MPWVAFAAFLYGSGRVGIDGPGPARRHRELRRPKLIGTGPFKLDELGAQPAASWPRRTPTTGRPTPTATRCRTSTRSSSGPIAEVRPAGQRPRRPARSTAIHTSDTESVIDDLRGLAERGEVNAHRVERLRRGQLRHAERVQAAVRQHQGPPGDGLRRRLDDYNAIRGEGILDRPRTLRPGQRRLPRGHRLPELRPRRGQAASSQEYEEETGQPLSFTYTHDPGRSTLDGPVHPAAGRGTSASSVEIVTRRPGDPDRQRHRAATSRPSAGATTPAATPTRSTSGGIDGYRRRELRPHQRPRDRPAARRGPHEPDRGRREADLQDLNRRFGQEVYNIWSYCTTCGRRDAPDVHGVLGRGPDERRAVPRPGHRASRHGYLWVEQ